MHRAPRSLPPPLSAFVLCPHPLYVAFVQAGVMDCRECTWVTDSPPECATALSWRTYRATKREIEGGGERERPEKRTGEGVCGGNTKCHGRKWMF